MVLTVRHVGDRGARETERWNCRGRDARTVFASRIPGSPKPVTEPESGARARSWQRRNWSPNSETTSPLVIFRFSVLLWCCGFHILVGAENDVSQRSGFSWDGGTRRREETTLNPRGMTVSFRRGEPRWRGTAVCWWLQQSWLQLLDPGGESEWNTANDSREPRQAPRAAAPPPHPPLNSTQTLFHGKCVCVHNDE